MSQRTTKLSGKNILLIGGSSGIGFAVAEQALQDGAHITISSSTEDRISKSVNSLRTNFPEQADNVRSYVADLSSKTELERTVEGLLQYAAKDSPIDHIVFTAGDVPPLDPLPEASFDHIDAFFAVRFYGAITVAKYAPKYMVPAKSSSITLTSGTQAHKPTMWLPPAIGCVVEGLMRGLAVTLPPIRVNVVSPGFILTEIIERLPKEMSENAIERHKQQSLTKDVGYPGDTAEAYLYFMRDSFVTGSVLVTNGGVFLV
ncbi:oxidoreductase [Talaromyces proteolyticus]|uniref:Oxidoreductase n=1 Tax=Talaromyces proteolyticus TaxID=1131652 RepID=A0AAD4KEU4_9EURO|nr:oxidoreductase [Talaromyces proteolyticus]KAH8690255.1 oxidoreductase [Talaromyces proteolyticus]